MMKNGRANHGKTNESVWSGHPQKISTTSVSNGVKSAWMSEMPRKREREGLCQASPSRPVGSSYPTRHVMQNDDVGGPGHLNQSKSVER